MLVGVSTFLGFLLRVEIPAHQRGHPVAVQIRRVCLLWMRTPPLWGAEEAGVVTGVSFSLVSGLARASRVRPTADVIT